MQVITFADKSALNQNTSIADTNKCNASDLNQIKNVVNANATECGDSASLNTTSKTSLVSAINEVNTGLAGKQATILTGTSLPGTVTNGAIFLLYS